MPIRIDALRAFAWKTNSGILHAIAGNVGANGPANSRIVSESDYRKLMALVNAVDAFLAGYTEIAQLACALDALRKKGKKT
jgi:hypothetical protein